MNEWKFSLYFQLLCLILLGACTAEHELPTQTDGNPSFQIKENYVANESSRKNKFVPINFISKGYFYP